MTDPEPPRLSKVLIGTLIIAVTGAAFGAILARIVS